MKNAFFLLAFICFQTLAHAQTSWIRINQIGYLTDDVKVAVLVSKDAQLLVKDFEVCDAFTDYGDYSTNEPTMDGTASLVYFLAAQEAHGRALLNNKIVDK